MSTRALFTLVALAAVLFSWTQGVFDNKDIKVTQSPNDDRLYQYYELPNRLKVLLISDANTDLSGAALDVYAGSNADPAGRQGLAHFLEHMLFLGTKDFPDVEEYQSFISTHGGSHNAYTSGQHTNYFFEISQDKLVGALDRFAPFFINPLLNETYVKREQNAVHSEYQSKMQDDYRRMHYASVQTMNPKHPQAHFATGSLETLADRENSKVRDDLIKFYKQYYSANLMSLVVLGRESLPELKSWVDARFSAIPDNNAQVLRTQEPLYAPNSLPMQIQIEPVKDLRQLSFSFPLPSLLAQYQSKPGEFLGNLLGHEGQGSLLDVLKQQGLALGLSAGSGRSSLDDASFHISIDLTDKGLAQTEEITALLFQYINLIQQQGLEQWRFDEQAKLAQLSFQYQQKGSTTGTVSNLATNLHVYAPEDVISGDYLQTQFKPELLKELLAELRPDNMVRAVIAKEQQLDQIEPWFKAPYQISKISLEQINTWAELVDNENLALPKVNPFIAENIEMLASSNDQPAPQSNSKTASLNLWQQQDTSFNSPRGNLFINLRSQASKISAENQVLTHLLAKVIDEQLNSYSYPARLAGLGYSIYAHQRGISIKVSGYSDKQFLLLQTVIKQLTDFSIEEPLFSRIKDDFKRDIANQLLNKPFQQSISRLREMMISPYYSVEDQLSAIDKVQLASLIKFHTDFFNGLEVTGLIQGNHDSTTTTQLENLLTQQVLSRSKPLEVIAPQVYQLDSSYSRELAIQHNDSSFTQYFQGTSKNLKERARFGLMGQVISSPYYQHMRTDKQLGYVVFATPLPLLEVPGLALIVQSPVATPSQILAESDRFLQSYVGILANMSDEQLNEHKQGLINRLKEKPKNLREKAERLWKDLDIGNYQFNTLDAIADEVSNISKAELEQLLKQMLDRSKSVLLQSTSMQKTDSLPTQYKETTDLSTQKLFPAS